MELITIYNNGLKVANYDAYKSELENELTTIKVPVITNDSDKKLVKDTQVKLNHLKKDLNDLRISKVKEISSEFEEQVKTLVTMINEKTECTKKALQDYEESKKVIIEGVELAPTYKYTITVETTDASVVEAIKKTCQHQACTLEIKTKELK